MTLNYGTWSAGLANLLVISSADANFVAALPIIVDQAEQDMYRTLDLLATRVTDSTGALTAGSHIFTLPTDVGTYLVVEGINVITPSTASVSTGTRVPLTATSIEFLDMCYPSNTALSTTPEFYAMRDNATLRLGPTPDANYPVEVRGTQRPTPLSSANSSTILTQMLPDAFMTGSCMFGAAYLKNFGAQSDDPRSGMSWSTLYEKQMQSANVEEVRKKFWSQGWTNKNPSPVASPPRV